jgi:hypothetical protein
LYFVQLFFHIFVYTTLSNRIIIMQILFLFLSLLLPLVQSLGAQGAYVVVLHAGNGAAALSTAATQLAVEEYGYDGSLLSSYPLPFLASSVFPACTLAGTQVTEGNIEVSVDGRYYSFVCYNASSGYASVSTSAPATVSRVIGIVDACNALQFPSYISDTSTSIVRTAATTDGSEFWVTTSTSSLLYTRSQNLGVSTVIVPSQVASRDTHIYKGNLYFSAQTTPFPSYYRVGTGLPRALIPSTSMFHLDNLPPGTDPQQFDFCDDNTIAFTDNTNGLNVYTRPNAAANFSVLYNLQRPNITVNLHGCLCKPASNGASGFDIIVTTTETPANRIMRFNTVTVQWVTLATAPVNTWFRGMGAPVTDFSCRTGTPSSTPIGPPSFTPTAAPTGATEAEKARLSAQQSFNATIGGVVAGFCVIVIILIALVIFFAMKSKKLENLQKMQGATVKQGSDDSFNDVELAPSPRPGVKKSNSKSNVSPSSRSSSRDVSSPLAVARAAMEGSRR